MGNSEVGHTNIGAGRVVYQELTRITKSIADGDFFTNPALLNAIKNCKKKDSALHLMGLLSDGGVHSHIEHMYALVEMAKRQGVSRVYIHGLLDGRDVPPSSAADFIDQTNAKLEEMKCNKNCTLKQKQEQKQKIKDLKAEIKDKKKQHRKRRKEYRG